MFWVLKKNVSLRRFFWVPTTYVLDEKQEKFFFCYALLTKVLFKVGFGIPKHT